MAEEHFMDDEEFMAWANEYYADWESEYTGNVETAYAAFCAGRLLSESNDADTRRTVST